MIERFGARAVALAAMAFVLVLLVLFAIYQWDKRKSERAQSRVQRGQTEALSNSAGDAINTVAASGEASAASEGLTRSNEKDIRNAQGADDTVNPAVRDAGLRSLCRRPAYRDSERCKLLGAPPR